MPLRFVYLELSLAWQVLSFDVSDLEDSDEKVDYLMDLFYMGLQVLPYMFTSAFARIFYFTVRVVPSPKPIVPLMKIEDTSYQQQYNIWYYVDLQQREHDYSSAKGSTQPTNRQRDGANLGTSERGDSVEGGNGVELRPVKSATGETSSPLHPIPDTPKSQKKVLPEREKATEKPVVLYSDEDIHRMFPADAQHHVRRKADADDGGLSGASAVAVASVETAAAMDELRGEIAAIMVAQIAAQAEARAAQEQIIALMQVLARK